MEESLAKSRAVIAEARERLEQPPSSAVNPHCAVHVHFTATCADCGRARAAFLPYETRSKGESSRSFAGPYTEPMIVESTQSLKELIVTEIAGQVVAALVESLLP